MTFFFLRVTLRREICIENKHRQCSIQSVHPELTASAGATPHFTKGKRDSSVPGNNCGSMELLRDMHSRAAGIGGNCSKAQHIAVDFISFPWSDSKKQVYLR